MRAKIYCKACGWYGISLITKEANFGGECPQCGGKLKMVGRKMKVLLSSSAGGHEGIVGSPQEKSLRISD